jgi:hypothetical protein
MCSYQNLLESCEKVKCSGASYLFVATNIVGVLSKTVTVDQYGVAQPEIVLKELSF